MQKIQLLAFYGSSCVQSCILISSAVGMGAECFCISAPGISDLLGVYAYTALHWIRWRILLKICMSFAREWCGMEQMQKRSNLVLQWPNFGILTWQLDCNFTEVLWFGLIVQFEENKQTEKYIPSCRMLLVLLCQSTVIGPLDLQHIS